MGNNNSTATKKAGEVFKNIVSIPKTISDNVQDVIKDTVSGKNVITSIKENAKDIAEEITGSFKNTSSNTTSYGGASGAGTTNNNNSNQLTDFFEDVKWDSLNQTTTNDAPTTTIEPVIKDTVVKVDTGIDVSDRVTENTPIKETAIESTGSFNPNGSGQMLSQTQNNSRNDTNSFRPSHGKRPNLESSTNNSNNTSNVTNNASAPDRWSNYYFNGRNNTDMTMDMINNKTGSFKPGSSNQMMRPNSFGPGGPRPPGQFGGMNHMSMNNPRGGGQRPPPPINRYWK